MHDHTSLDAPMSEARMSVRFGPQTVLVERFLMRLSKLPVATWLSAGAMYQGLSQGTVSQFANGGTAADAEAWREADVALSAAMEAQPSAYNRVTRRVLTVATATKGIVPRGSYDSLLKAALTAVYALICREQVGPAAFHLLYAPFATIIPISELESPEP